MKHRLYILLLLLLAVAVVDATPRLVVNIVVGGMRHGDIARYEKNLSNDGFLRLRNEGAEFTECYANYAPTTSEAGLATFATGTTPSMHGIFSSVGYDRISGTEIQTCFTPRPDLRGLVRKEVEEERSTKSFTVPTFSESVVNSFVRNRAITIAHKPLSAMILAGQKGECYWLNDKGRWMSADCYMESLPSWVRSYNAEEVNRMFATETWYGRYTRDHYRNSRITDITVYEKGRSKRERQSRKVSEGWVDRMLSMPSGNFAIFEFAKRAIGQLVPLHVKDECKVLNICLDVPRTIAERYGPDSIEYEDMLYSLDALIAEFLTFLYAQLPSRKDVMVVLTSDGGMSPTSRENSDTHRFNSRQFGVIMNAFLSARYGQDNWVLGYTNGSLYLNHDVIYRHKLSVEEVQNEAATFALQYRGVATAVTATAMRSAQFSNGVLSLLQNGYNPRRSGDVMLSLEVNRVELDSHRVAMSGSVYNYDRHIPLIISGGDIPAQRITQRVCSEQIAPTLASILGVERPQCSDAEILTIGEKKN